MAHAEAYKDPGTPEEQTRRVFMANAVVALGGGLDRDDLVLQRRVVERFDRGRGQRGVGDHHVGDAFAAARAPVARQRDAFRIAAERREELRDLRARDAFRNAANQ